MVDINVTLIIQIVNFLILILALNHFLYKPIRNILAQRKGKISGLEESVKQAEENVVKKDSALESGLKKAREKGLKEKDECENTAHQEEIKLIEKINEKARTDLAEIREKVSHETQSVRSALLKEIDSFADEISRKILGRAV